MMYPVVRLSRWTMILALLLGLFAMPCVSQTVGESMMPPTHPVLESPTNGAKFMPVNARLTWKAATRATHYYVHVSATELNGERIDDDRDSDRITDTSWVTPNLIPGATYSWRVTAINDNDPFHTEMNSVTWTFTVAPPPEVPKPLLPANTAVKVSTDPRLIWSAVSGTQCYQIQIARNDSFTDGLIASDHVTGTMFQTFDLQPYTRYFWRVRAVNSAGISAWSTIFAFTTVDSVDRLPAPALLSPPDNATDVSPQLRLCWERNSEAKGYWLQLARDPSFSSPLVNRKYASAYADISGLANGETYYWRVAAFNDTEGYWSEIRSFTTSAGYGTPLPPLLEFPSNGTMNLGTSVRLKWLPADQATFYTVEIMSAGTANVIFRRNNIRDTFVDITNLQPGTRYLWHVYTVRYLGYSSAVSQWSDTWSFTTADLVRVPTTPKPITPAAGASGVSTALHFSWSPSERVETYTLQYALDASFTSGVISRNFITGAWIDLENLKGYTRYYWRVRAVNRQGMSPWSTTYTFVTGEVRKILPGKATLLYPGDHATALSTAPQFAWTAVANTATYTVQLAKDRDFTVGVINQEVTCPFAVVGGLTPNTRYYWRVRSANASGFGEWSEPRTFITAVTAMTMLAPL